MQSFIELIIEYSKISSAYNLILHCTEAGMSFTKYKNNKGASQFLTIKTVSKTLCGKTRYC